MTETEERVKTILKRLDEVPVEFYLAQYPSPVVAAEGELCLKLSDEPVVLCVRDESESAQGIYFNSIHVRADVIDEDLVDLLESATGPLPNQARYVM